MFQHRDGESPEAEPLRILCVLHNSVLNPGVHGKISPKLDSRIEPEKCERMGTPTSLSALVVRRSKAGEDAGAPVQEKVLQFIGRALHLGNGLAERT